MNWHLQTWDAGHKGIILKTRDTKLWKYWFKLDTSDWWEYTKTGWKKI